MWLTVLFLPLVPLGRLVLAGEGPDWEICRTRAANPGRTLSTILVFYVGTVLAFVPAYIAVRYFVGNQLLSLTGLYCTLGVVVGALAWLDSTRGRIPLRAIRAVFAAGARVS